MKLYLEDIDSQIDAYANLFDRLVQGHRIPAIYQDDQLAQFIQAQIDHYADQHHDETMMALLRANLMEYFHQVLPYILEIQEDYLDEQTMIRNFFSQPIEGKRNQWFNLKKWIKTHYAAESFNIEGYTVQFGQKEKSVDQIFEAMQQHWYSLSEQRAQRRIERLLYPNTGMAFQGVRPTDIARHRKLEKIAYTYPKLAEIVRKIGRSEDSLNQDKDALLSVDIPLLLSHSSSKQEISGVTTGRDLTHLLPIEYAIMDEPLFLKKYVSGELQQFAGQTPAKLTQKALRHQLQPRKEKGPIIVAVDTSYSMEGKPFLIAKAITTQLVELARKQQRKCLLMTYSVRAKAIEISRPSQYRHIEAFFSEGYSGGTNGNQMFTLALKALRDETFSLADVLIVSDFEFPLPEDQLLSQIESAQSQGTRFYGLCISRKTHPYIQLLDGHWRVVV